jgi:hypothetical protein
MKIDLSTGNFHCLLSLLLIFSSHENIWNIFGALLTGLREKKMKTLITNLTS